MHRLLDAADDRSAPTRLHPGAVLGFDIAAEGQLRGLRYERDDIHQVELSLVGDEVRQRVIERPVTTRTVVVSVEVGKSLFWSARKQGLPGRAINQHTDETFQSDIDFSSAVVARDRYSVLVKHLWPAGPRPP